MSAYLQSDAPSETYALELDQKIQNMGRYIRYAIDNCDSFPDLAVPSPQECPESVRVSILNYLERGIPPGDFVQAVLANEFVEAFCRADMNNIHAMHHIAAYVYHTVPAIAYGSRTIVKAVIEAGGVAKLSGRLTGSDATADVSVAAGTQSPRM
ncbi:MAG TPA: hypothetical protein VIV60_30515 [Polyangiaceae bacterium]